MSFPRYPAYKGSGVEWLGRLPEHWAAIRLKNVLAQRITDGPHLTPVFVAEGVPFLSVDGIQNGELTFDSCRYISQEDHVEFSKKVQPQRDDLLMGKAASTGKIARVKVDFEFSIWSPLALIRVDSQAVLPDFVEYALKSSETQAEIDALCTSNTQKNISMDDIPKLALACPPLDEQASIATFLDSETAKIDALVAEQEKLIELLKEKRQAVISHAVTKGLDQSVPLKDSGVEWLGEVPAHWVVMQIRALAAFVTSGPRGWSERISDEGALFIQSGDLTEKLTVDFAGANRVSVTDDAESTRTRLESGDVVVCITGAKTGNVAICDVVPEDAFVNQHLCLVRPTPYIAPQFLGTFLKSDTGQRQFAIAQYGLKQGLSLENIKETKVAVPPLVEQMAIVEAVSRGASNYEGLISEATQAIELLRERRTALISAAVTGQIDVRSFV